MDDYNYRKLKDCVFNISDKLDSIKAELFNPKPYEGYILEKAYPIANDINVIINLCKGGENESN